LFVYFVVPLLNTDGQHSCVLAEFRSLPGPTAPYDIWINTIEDPDDIHFRRPDLALCLFRAPYTSSLKREKAHYFAKVISDGRMVFMLSVLTVWKKRIFDEKIFRNICFSPGFALRR
jgi:hypothetical protein